MEKIKEMTQVVRDIDWMMVGYRVLAVGIGLIGAAFSLFFFWGAVDVMSNASEGFGYVIGGMLLLGFGLAVSTVMCFVVSKMWKGDDIFE